MQAILRPIQSNKRLGFKHALHLKAAECWLALGEIEEARQELQKITRKHPAVAQAHQKIQAHIDWVRTLLPEVVPPSDWDAEPS